MLRMFKYFTCLWLALAPCMLAGQYLVTGHLEGRAGKTVYLSLLNYDQEYYISNDQILFSTKTDSTGHFEFTGQLLPNKDQFYRIHANLHEDGQLQLIDTEEQKNYHNFLFSNKDTIMFAPLGGSMFGKAQNTNGADHSWKKLKKYKARLIQAFSETKNTAAKEQAKQDLVKKLQWYSKDSLTFPLVKLLAYAEIKRLQPDLKEDFKDNPPFYEDIQDQLQKEYSETSYYLQYQEELSKLSHSIINQKLLFHKNLNYILGILAVVLLTAALFFRSRYTQLKPKDSKGSTLTLQEEKIAKLICEDSSNKEIADALFISISTVKTHISNLYTKLDVANRKELKLKFKDQYKD